MIKRLGLSLVLVAGALAGMTAHGASCVAAAPYYHASATFPDAGGHRVTIYGESVGTFAGGVAGACTDASTYDPLAPRPLMTISVDGHEVCRRTDPTSRLTSDPVAHAGGGVHNPADPSDPAHGDCGADVSWEALVATPTGGLGQTITADSSGLQATPLCKSTTFLGNYWLGGGPVVAVPLDVGLPVPIVGRAYFCETGAKIATDFYGV